jgi:hypothetical protein
MAVRLWSVGRFEVTSASSVAISVERSSAY